MKTKHTRWSPVLVLLLLVAPGCEEGLPPPTNAGTTDARFPMLEQSAELRTLRAVRHNQEALEIIAEAERNEPERKEQAMLDGLKFIIRLIDADQALRSIAPDALQMLHDLTVIDPESALARASHRVIESSFARIAADLPTHFNRDLHGKWTFISVLRPLYAHGIAIEPFLGFYQWQFPAGDDAYFDIFDNIEYDEALRTANYGSMGNYLIYTSFLHLLIEDYPEADFDLPEDRYPAYLQQLEGFSYAAQPEQAEAYVEQNYFVTHLALMLAKWGEAPMPDNEMARAVRSYVDGHYDWVMNESGDLVLYAEFVEVLRLFDSEDPRIEQAEQILLAHQKADGSWGAEEDTPITEDAYYAFHPTWAVMAALRHPS